MDMKFFTSYYANYKNIPSNYHCVGISRMLPSGFTQLGMENFSWYRNSFLAPSEDLLSRFKKGEVDEDFYKKDYLEQLSKYFESYGGMDKWISDIEKHYAKYDAVVFLCYESPEKFCHRHILAKVLSYYGYPCDEFSPEKKINKKESDFSLF